VRVEEGHFGLVKEGILVVICFGRLVFEGKLQGMRKDCVEVVRGPGERFSKILYCREAVN
jgi:hypothetical protein